ncbi:hypothetical protein KAT59_04815, partial [Candidatus Bipolaricaulota bacterium]|nr:hypothetical protein [Candidatus Bipolaricaulota bacterium]
DISYTTVDDVCSILEDGSGYYEFVCVAKEYYKVWETFGIESTGDACCGGAFDFSIDIYFGTRYVLTGYAWDYECVVPTTPIVGEFRWGTGVAPSTWTSPTRGDKLVKTSTYVDAGNGTLFGWVETEVAATFGIASNFSINFGLGVSVYGWESLDFGFELTF